MPKIKNSDIVAKCKPFKGFPKVAVDQTNVRISDIIRRNLAGEQVMGTTKLAYDYLGTEEFKDMKVNPFNTLDFDLDDLIRLAAENGRRIDELQTRAGELDAEKAKLLSETRAKETPPVDPAAPSEPSTKE